MSVLNVVLYPDEPLTRVASPIQEIGPEIQRLAEDMFETMYAYDGVGLAGPQVGLAQRIFVLHEPDGPRMCLVNPEITEMDGREEGQEGCLSLPEIYVQVPRATRIRVRALDERGHLIEFEAYDFLARIVQHELDHLDGTILLDRIDPAMRDEMLAEWSEIRERLIASGARG